MYTTFKNHLADELAGIEAAGLTKRERGIAGPQQAEITTGGAQVLNFCANNYLGLADDPRILAAAKGSLDTWGYGLASVRFICGTQDQHLELERRLAGFLGTDDAILYSSCFDANGGVFETLFTAEDAIISDELNHASIIDGIRLSKARRLRYRNRDMADLEEQLKAASDARFRVIVTDGVFSMDGYIAPLQEICDLAERYDALVFVDDSHAVGFVGEHGRGTPELCGVEGRVDIYTGTFGKALGGGLGWIRRRAPRDRRPAAPALAPVPVLEHAGAVDRRRNADGARPRGGVGRPSCPSARERRAVPRPHDRRGLRAAAGRAPDRPRDVR